MSLNIYPSQYIESMSIQWVHVYTKSPCQYHKSMSIPWVHVYTMSTCQFNAPMSIPCVLSNNISQCLYHESRKSNYRNKQITEIHILEKRKRNYIKTEIEMTKIPKLQKYRNVNYRNTEIITERLSTIVHKYKGGATLQLSWTSKTNPCSLTSPLKKNAPCFGSIEVWWYIWICMRRISLKVPQSTFYSLVLFSLKHPTFVANLV